jgi:hypothetical protein
MDSFTEPVQPKRRFVAPNDKWLVSPAGRIIASHLDCPFRAVPFVG